MKHLSFRTSATGIFVLSLVAILALTVMVQGVRSQSINKDPTSDNAISLVTLGRQTFRFDTFGDQAFWGDALKLHQAIEGSALGGVGPGVSPKLALTVGLKVDSDALPRNLLEQLQHGKVDLNDPSVTVALLKLNAVVGVTGIFDSAGALKSMGIQCALCHSTVDNSEPALCAGVIQPNPGTGCVGHRLDGWPNRDLNVGGIIALAPDLDSIASLLSTTQASVRTVLNSWGPGKFDAELLLDGKASNPQQITDGVVTGTNVSGATLIPPAFGLGGVNLHTWTGWGSVPHWNAFVATLEMHGKGRFWDPRLNDAVQFPISGICDFLTGNISARMTTWSRRNCKRFSSTNWPYLRHNLPLGVSIPLPRRAETSCSAEKRNAITATSSRSGPTLAGTCTCPPRSASIAFRPTVRRTTAIERRPSATCLRTSKAAFIMTGGFRHS
jgi:hypothetical protein